MSSSRHFGYDDGDTRDGGRRALHAFVPAVTGERGSRAPGGPGAPTTWSGAEKYGVGTATTADTRVWLSITDGVLGEVFYPAPDEALVRSMSFVVTHRGFHSDERVDTTHSSQPRPRAAPVLGTLSRCKEGRYCIEKETLCDPRANVVLQHIRFVPLAGSASAYRLFCILEPHLGERGDSGTAQVVLRAGVRFIVAYDKRGRAMALASSLPILVASVGFHGVSDGRHDLEKHGHLTHLYDNAEDGTVIAVAELGPLSEDAFTVTLGFGETPDAAMSAASESLARGCASARRDLERGWSAWMGRLRHIEVDGEVPRLYGQSTAVLKVLEAKPSGSGRVAALSTPWGASRGPGIDGTYHLVWTRDLVESAIALLAAEAHGEVAGALRYLARTQQRDGHWPQSMRLSGEPFWNSTEQDEVALPVVLFDLARRRGTLGEHELAPYWPMCRAAATFLAGRGPGTRRDRWEDTCGLTPFTMAAEVSSLLIVAEMAGRHGEHAFGSRLRELADEWNALIDSALYRKGGALAEHVGVEGYYVRARGPGEPLDDDLALDRLPKNEVSPDALALVRFGLRRADDPRIVNTVAVIDATLRRELPDGPSWRRYTGDEYGEYDDGAPFDGHGVGRCWPLLTGERAHYELAAGRFAGATSLLHAMESFASESDMLPEQVWDALPIPGRDLAPGRPTGSAAPLGWAHAEYVILCRSLADGAVFDLPEQTKRRYLESERRP